MQFDEYSRKKNFKLFVRCTLNFYTYLRKLRLCSSKNYGHYYFVGYPIISQISLN